ncbi:premnaspirodiene oxygenase-like [Olea europaea subsp. europaea]|uniref:Premnaspirodiene oxygenase-like n=1 Tax=Olea europaea subsp. europaea TaxID=158383 RepID=A0A8S0UKY5_OLEEU|nr:premnaspirodiene oxygenase-like [Olea europaea subsp. europaea]
MQLPRSFVRNFKHPIFASMDIHFLISLSNFCFLLSFFLFLVANRYKKSRAQNLPPGPWKLPILGNLHLLIGSLPHHAFKNLAEKYGPLMHIKLGEVSAIVVSSPRIAKEIMKTNDVAFSDRAELMIAKILLHNCSDIASAPYGEYWRQMRKLCISEFLCSKKVRSFHTLMENEASKLILSIRSSAGLQINLTEHILAVESGIICMATVGRICKDQNSIIMTIKEAVSIAGFFNVADVFPSMKFLHFLCGSERKLNRMQRRTDAILEDIIQQHQERKGQSKSSESMEEDILDIFLRISANKALPVPITRNNIKANILEMFIAGIETSSLVIEWAMSELMKNPGAMEKAQAEVRRSFDGKERILDSDIKELKYLKMIIKETLRLHPPGPLLCPRMCREQCKLDGYDIPAKTIVMTNVWAMARNPEYWNDPEKFEPERFSNVPIDFNGNHYEFIPFGAGRRMCPGISFGLASVEISLSQLLYHFDWKIPGGISPEEFDMTENFGASGGRKNHLFLIPVSYYPLHSSK